MGLRKFFRHMRRYNWTYVRNKTYDSTLRKAVESGIHSKRLHRIYPGLEKTFELQKDDLRRILLPFFEEYIRDVSSEIMAISLELSAFLLFLCDLRRPRRILDLGSGFSSFVFRHHMSGANPKPDVWSVDDSREWLDKTRSFLTRRNLPADRLISWDDFVRQDPGRFDLILYDLGGFEFRKNSLVRVLRSAEAGGVLILDDVHAADYGRYVIRALKDRNRDYFNIRSYTLDHYGRYSFFVPC